MPPLPYRLCAIDLDDTLLGPDHQISARNARAVAAAIAKGVTVVLASGRMHESTLIFARQLGLDTPVISYHGALVKHARTGEVWWHERLPGDLGAVVLDYCSEHSLHLNFYLNDHLYVAAYTPWIKLYHERTSSPFEVLPDFYVTLRGAAPTKLIIIDTPETTDRLLPYFQDLFADSLYITKSNVEYLEFTSPNVNKGRALEMVAHRFGFTAADTIAFGDSWNDVPMLQWAGLGVAVGNARPEVIAVADRVIGRSEEDGVGVALEEIFGLT
ncbi:MAG TPA: Cof-type HAD-IIB family hydrolase [Chthonomonadaceae bacterium]|nr:Cof-type HAD-IIB family hydrolase [Chthonomonadaceae bacterium]